MKNIKVVAAIIVYKNKILCLKKGEHKYNYISNKYEFPGGKIEVGETNETALKREILEELELNIKIQKPFLIVNHFYPDFSITLHSYICTTNTANFTLTEHVDFKWLKKEEISKLDWAEADIPIVKSLIQMND